jgi:glycosyltransferase involved in cell wall biosynthesis
VPANTTRILINGSFRGQRVTGQQRYAIEIADRLLPLDGVRESRERSGPGSPAVRWARAQVVGIRRSRRERLLTLTSRGPFRGRRQVIVVHDLFVLDHPEWFSKRYVATHAPLLRSQLRSAELVVCVSEPVAEATRLRLGSAARVVTVPNAPAELFAVGLPDPDCLAGHGLRRGGFVLAVGSRDPRKNLPLLAAAHAELPEELRTRFPLVVAGGSSSIYADESSASSADTIHLGYVEDAELARLYSAAALVAFPSIDEGFGLPAVEAIASGADVVVSDIPVLRWVCGTAARYADPTSIESVVSALRAALENPSSEVERAERAEHIRTRFSWDSSARLLYNEIAALEGAS